MVIAFDGWNAVMDQGEAGRLSRSVIVAMARTYPDCRFEVYVPVSGKSGKLGFLQGSPNVKICPPGNLFWRLFPGIWHRYGIGPELKRRRPDIFHGLDGELPGHLGRKNSPGLVVSVKDLGFLSERYGYSWIQRHRYNLRTRHACRLADRIITESKASAADVVKYYFIPKERISTVSLEGERQFSSGDAARFMEIYRKQVNCLP